MTDRWSMDKGNDGAVISDDSGTIATVSDEMTAWSANADLLFAAPDMLAALKTANDAILKLSLTAGNDPRFNKGGFAFEATELADAAISKATGGVASSRKITCERCQGNGEIVTDWDRYMHEHDGDTGDEAVDQCPDCDGEGLVDLSAPAPAVTVAECIGLMKYLDFEIQAGCSDATWDNICERMRALIA